MGTGLAWKMCWQSPMSNKSQKSPLPESQKVAAESHRLAKSQDQGCFHAFSQGNASRAAVAIKITAGSCRVCG